MDVELHDAHPAELDVPTAYAVLRLRTDVFVVEQQCAYAELDGRDLEPDARWHWAAVDGTIVATLRTLAEPDGATRIGRVATAPSARSLGLAAQLVRSAMERAGEAPVVLDAQAYLTGWYARFGFVVCGPEFVEDGIAHVPMQVRR